MDESCVILMIYSVITLTALSCKVQELNGHGDDHFPHGFAKQIGPHEIHRHWFTVILRSRIAKAKSKVTHT